MKTLVAAVAVLCLAGTTEDLKYEVAVREAFGELEARVAAIQAETGTTNPDRLVPVLIARRSLWMSDRGEFFERLNNGFYVHKAANGDAKLFTVAEKRNEYIELGLVGGGWVMRLYEDRLDVKGPGKDWKRVGPGKWER